VTTVIQWIVNGLSLGSTYALLALGLMLVFSVMNLINFAYGMLLVWSGYIAIELTNAHVPGVIAVVACIAFTAALSVAIGRVAFRPFLNAPPIALLITSFGVELVVQYIAILAFGENPHVMPSPGFLNKVFDVAGVRVPSIELVTIGTGIVVLGALFVLMQRTTFGIEVRAAAERPDVARLMGVKPARVLTTVFAVSGAIAGIVGLLWFAKLGAITPESDLSPTLEAFVAIVLGGLGTLSGAVAGGFALGALETLMQAVLPSGALDYQDAIVFGLVIAILLLRPGGLAGSALSVTE
jgi:branched-chain amino acid transport system permease protein